MSEPRPYQRCTVSVLDTVDDPNMHFDAEGRCQYFHEFQKVSRLNVRSGADGAAALAQLVEEVKHSGKGKRYDSVIGLSGGVDSTYVALLAARSGLRPLAVHFDNGWNSEIAVRNIENVVNRFGWDLHTLVVDWDEFRDLQLSYLRASVVDVEIATDHAIAATLCKLALKHEIRYVLSGSNVATEAIIPPHWIFNKTDHKNLLDIHRRFGTVPLKTYPLYDTLLKKRIGLAAVKWIAPLNLVPYVYEDVKKEIAAKLGWTDYGGKHHESIFTRFYQCFILPQKFSIDKRKAHLSNLIFSGQLSRDEALQRISQLPCSREMTLADKEFVLKKLGLSETDFTSLMSAPQRSHEEFEVEKPLRARFPGLSLLSPAFSAAKAVAAAFRR